MVKVDLNLLNIFVLRVKKNKITYEGNNVSDIISQFLKEYKDLLDDSILSKNKKKLNSQMIILLNGRNISYMQNYKTKLNEGDQLYISFPISGG
ncbi:MAG: MoaD/ThiS family protein [Promethearchaeota archaeon]